MRTLLLTIFISSIVAASCSGTDSGDDNVDSQISQGIEKADVIDKRTLGDIPEEGLLNENDREMLQKRVFGHLLGNGYAFGKRDHAAFKRPFGWSFRRGLFSKKSDGESFQDDLAEVDLDGPVDDDEKRWAGDVSGGGYQFKKRSKRDLPDKRYIRYFGHMLGRGYAFGKRNGDNLYINGDMLPDSDGNDDTYPIVVDPSDIDDVYTEDEDVYTIPQWYGNDDDTAEYLQLGKRYFNSDPGYRFLFGKKRNGNRYPGYANRKRFGYVLGGGFAFGKRSLNPDNDATGFTQGDDLQNLADLEKRYGLVLGKGFRLGAPSTRGWSTGQRMPYDKRSGEMNPDFSEMDGEQADGYVLADDKGNILTPDKRFVFSQAYKYGKTQPKRFGYVLGSGFRLGKRGDGLVDINDIGTDKRGYGYLLGRGYRFGKRWGSRRYKFGNVLGSGLSFGKRAESAELPAETAKGDQ